jgi:hypothetical protein
VIRGKNFQLKNIQFLGEMKLIFIIFLFSFLLNEINTKNRNIDSYDIIKKKEIEMDNFIKNDLSLDKILSN